jgi:ferredoxin
VLLLEVGEHKTAADYMRWEAKANHDLWWPITQAFAEPPPVGHRGHAVPRPLRRRWHDDQHEGRPAPARRGLREVVRRERPARRRRRAVRRGDLLPYSSASSSGSGSQAQTDWQQCVKTVEPGFAGARRDARAGDSYTDANCMRCGSCLQGCPTNAGKSTLNVYIHPPWASGRLELRAGCEVQRVLIEDGGDGPAGTGVEYLDPAGERSRSTPTSWSSPRARSRPPAADPLGRARDRRRLARAPADRAQPRLSPLAPRLRPVRRDPGRPPRLSDHRALHEFQRDADGGFIVEASTIMDPIAFATLSATSRACRCGVRSWSM